MGHFKDKENINHKTCEIENLKELAKKCQKAYASKNPSVLLEKYLLDGEDKNEGKEHNDKGHNGCKGCNTEKETEKRICRCMYYYNNMFPNACEDCSILHRWKNAGKLQVTEYEMPTKFVMKKIGGMDLIIDNHYAAEVKPPKSKETLSRMFAETLTYTLDNEKGYEPAIAVFYKSAQWNTLKKLYGKLEALDELIKHVKVFVIFYEYRDGIAKYRIEAFDESMIYIEETR